MKWLKYLLYLIIGLVALFLLLGAVLSKKYTISESNTINKPKAVLYDYVKMLKNQNEYSEWVLADPKTVVTIDGTDGTVGAKQSWKSEISGEGFQTISKLTDDRIDVDLTFIKPMSGTAKAAIIFTAIDSTSTKVTSEFYGNDKWPMNVMSHLFGIPMIRQNEKKNLANIKRIMEGK